MTLIDRLSNLDGPDRRIDEEIKAWSMNARKLCVRDVGEIYVMGDECAERVFLNPIEPFTASVDAAIALAERVLPDHDFIIGKTNCGLTIHAQVGTNEMEFGANPAIALCIAILRAKEASHGE